MGNFDGPSRCSGGSLLKFRWFGFPQAVEGQDLAVVLEKFQSIIAAPNRLTNGYVWGMAKAEVKNRIQLAANGKLRAPAQIKPVDTSNPPPLFEIRWQGITVQEVQPDGTKLDLSILVRMYHSEPAEAPVHFIAHHIHEKDVSNPSKANERQTTEIGVAKKYFDLGKPVFWGISELTGVRKSIR